MFATSYSSKLKCLSVAGSGIREIKLTPVAITFGATVKQDVLRGRRTRREKARRPNETSGVVKRRERAKFSYDPGIFRLFLFH